MDLHHLFQHASALLGEILVGRLPADKHMEQYFRAHRTLGARDRGEVAEAVYDCLRRRAHYDFIAAQDWAPADALVIAHLLTAKALSARALAPLQIYSASPLAEFAARARLAAENLPDAARLNLPEWLASRLHTQFGAAETRALAEALSRPASVDLRANTLKCERAALAERLAADDYACDTTPYSPWGLRRSQRTALFHTASFREGWFEIQDEGSQLLALLVEPRRREMVVDFCAGAAGKTLALGAMMGNTGTLYAFDTSAARLKRAKARIVRAGLDTVRAVAIAHETEARVQRLYGKIDRVLVDAPCSGSGTLRRNPDLKWRPIDLSALCTQQARILAAAAPLLKPGGRLVYATCSLLAEENEHVVENFLATQPGFQRLAVNDILARRAPALRMDDDYLRLLPHRHHTDGFFAAVLERRA